MANLIGFTSELRRTCVLCTEGRRNRCPFTFLGLSPRKMECKDVHTLLGVSSITAPHRQFQFDAAFCGGKEGRTVPENRPGHQTYGKLMSVCCCCKHLIFCGTFLAS